jgi:hypothetical protein
MITAGKSTTLENLEDDRRRPRRITSAKTARSSFTILQADDPEHTILYIVNGEVSGRKIGDGTYAGLS